MASIVAVFLTGLYGFYNTVFQPVLALGPYISLGVFSAVLAAIFSVIYWFFLDIEKADEIKEKISEKQEEMKEARKEGETDKVSEYTQETMKLNQELMLLNLKPMIFTMVFVALVFPWLGATYAPSVPLEKTSEGVYTGNLEYAGEKVPVKVVNQSSNMSVSFGGEETSIGSSVKTLGIKWDVKKFKPENGGFFSIHEGAVLKLNARFVKLPFSIPLAGEALNWLGFYIVLAMPLTFIFRKLLGVS